MLQGHEGCGHIRVSPGCLEVSFLFSFPREGPYHTVAAHPPVGDTQDRPRRGLHLTSEHRVDIFASLLAPS